MTTIIAFVATLAVFAAIDFLWLRFAMTPVFRTDAPELLAKTPNAAAAAIFYVVFAAGLVYFAVLGGIDRNSVILAARDGGLIGLLAYATYELTNRATLRGWTWRLVIIDVIWGACLSAGAAAAGAWAALALMRA